MKAVAILLLAAIAMASAQGVNVVDNNPSAGQVSIVEQPGDAAKTVGQAQDIDSAFGRPSIGGNNVVISNPDPGFYQGGSISGVDPGFGRPSQGGDDIVIANPDPGFYLPGSNNARYEWRRQGSGRANAVHGPGPYAPPTVIQNPDPGFYLLSANVQPSIDPTFVIDSGFYRPSDPPVDSGRPYFSNRPLKYPNPAARGGQ